MKRKMIGFLTMALAVSAVGTLGSCKDYDDDNRVELQGEYLKLKTELEKMIEDAKCQCGDFEENLKNSGTFKALNEQLNGKDGEKGALQILNEDLDKLHESLYGKDGNGGINGDIAGMKGDISSIVTNYTKVLADVSALQTALAGKLDASTFNTAKTEITNLITGLQNTISSNNSEFNSKIANLQGQLDVLNSIDFADLQARIAALEGKECPQPTPGLTKKDVEDLIAANDTLWNNAINAAVSVVESNTNAAIADVQASLTATDQKYAAKIDSLDKAINKEIAALKAQLGSLVTSVLVQGTYNPVFGSLTAPFNVQSNVLAAYYGKATTDGKFPGALSVNNPIYVFDGDEGKNYYLTSKDMDMINLDDKNPVNFFSFNANDTLVDNEKDGTINAGTIYLTINPTAVNFEGLNFRLENSIGEASPVKLGNLEPSYKKLTFGWTRGAAKNGFYEAQATIAKKDINNAKLVVDMTKSDIQEIFKDVTSPKDGIDIMNIANKVYSVVNDVCEANAVKAYWGTDANANSTLSQYSIAATAVKPLRLDFMKDYHIDSFYGVDRVKNFINKTIDGFKLSLDIPEFDSDITITPIEFGGIKSEVGEDGKNHYYLTVSIKDEVVINDIKGTCNLGEFINGEAEVKIKDEEGNTSTGKLNLSEIFGNKEIEVVIKDQPQEIEITGEVDITNLIEPIDGFNENIEDLNKFLGQVNDMIEEINGINQKIEDAKDDVASQINKYIDALNKRLCNIVNGINDRLQPLAIAHNGKEFYTLSEIKNMPSKISGNTLHIVPTTYTAELVVPLFKKHVAVVNVFKGSASAQSGDATCQAVLKAANKHGNMNTVVAGTTRDVEFVGEKGYTYEIAYSALDYSGMAVTKKYYVTVE